jgi:hypothetical protein
MTVRMRLAVLLLLAAAPLVAVAREYAAIFNFGDSLADAGNLCVDGIPDYLTTAKLPYGSTYFGYPTGRVSGRPRRRRLHRYGRRERWLLIDLELSQVYVCMVMSSAGAGAAAAAAVQGAQRDVPPRRQLRDHGRHVAGHGLLPVARAGARRLELGVPARLDQVVPGHEARHLQQLRPACRVPRPVPAFAVHRGRVRRERLRRAAVRVPPPVGGARPGSPRGGLYRRGRRGPGGAGAAAHRLLPAVPVHVPQAAGGGVRRAQRVRQGPQHAVVAAQRRAAAQGRPAPGQAPRRAHRLRRLLHAGDPVRAPRREVG